MIFCKIFIPCSLAWETNPTFWLYIISSLSFYIFFFLVFQCKREGFFQSIKDEDGEGCNIHGSLEVNRVAGSFHFAPGKGFHLTNFFLDDLLAFQKDSYNVRLIFVFKFFLRWNYYVLVYICALLVTWMSIGNDVLYLCCTIQISHRINRLAFGEYFPGVVNPLDG